MSVIMFGGSRSLSSSPLVGQVVRAVLSSGASVGVGCATGADAQVIQAALAAGQSARLAVFAAFAQSGAGSWSCSAVPVVRSAARAGAQVTWLAGGALSLPLRARLILRSVAGLAQAGALVLFSPGPGSLTVACRAVLRGLPVFAFSAAQPASLPGIPGQWVASSFFGFACWAWVGQARLF